jgi:hypothetical protein
MLIDMPRDRYSTLYRSATYDSRAGGESKTEEITEVAAHAWG